MKAAYGGRVAEVTKIVILVTILAVFTGCAFNNYNYKGRITPSTPYDFQYKRVEEYLNKAKSFSYREDSKTSFDYWQIPPETEASGAGDCEDKAIWLYCKLIEDGFKNVRLFIGKYRNTDYNLHAWVVWYSPKGTFILDPTFNDGVWQSTRYPKGYYEPFYSYFRDKKWTHKQ